MNAQGTDFDTPLQSVAARVMWGPHGPTWSAREAMERFAYDCRSWVALIDADERRFQIASQPGVEYVLDDWISGWVVKTAQ